MKKKQLSKTSLSVKSKSWRRARRQSCRLQTFWKPEDEISSIAPMSRRRVTTHTSSVKSQRTVITQHIDERATTCRTRERGACMCTLLHEHADFIISAFRNIITKFNKAATKTQKPATRIREFFHSFPFIQFRVCRTRPAFGQ